MTGVAGAAPEGVAPRRCQRGMVTIELAVGLVGVVALLATLVGITTLGATQTAAGAAGQQIARQVARGDDDAAARARAELPPDSAVEVSRQEDGVSVRVVTTVQVFGLGEIPLEASSWAAWEPGVSP